MSADVQAAQLRWARGWIMWGRQLYGKTASPARNNEKIGRDVYALVGAPDRGTLTRNE